MRILVTGGAGFLGSALVRWITRERPDVAVTVLDAFTYAASHAALPAAVTVVHGDVTDAALVDRLVADADAIVHLAAESHNDAALRDPAPFVTSNVVGTFTVLEAARRHGVRLHHVSTDEVFGELADLEQPFSVGAPYRPSSPYSATKASSDLLVRAWVRSYGVWATITSATNCYGPYQDPEKFIPRQVTRILDGARPRLFGDGEQQREWLHADDHSAAVWSVLERGQAGETYLVGGGRTWTNREVVTMLLLRMGRSPDEFDLVPDRPGHDRRYAVDSTPLRANLGWAPRTTGLAEGLAATIAWYEAHESWWRPRQAHAERTYDPTGQ